MNTLILYEVRQCLYYCTNVQMQCESLKCNHHVSIISMSRKQQTRMSNAFPWLLSLFLSFFQTFFETSDFWRFSRRVIKLYLISEQLQNSHFINHQTDLTYCSTVSVHNWLKWQRHKYINTDPFSSILGHKQGYQTSNIRGRKNYQV